MNVEEFLSTLDAIRFDTDIDEQYGPELRIKAKKIYPYLRDLYNMMYEAGILNESVNEAHGNKKHNTPKDELSAIRKGNRDAEMDINGPGFKSKSKMHKTSKNDRKPEKINKNNYEKFIDECVKKTLKEFVELDDSEKEDFGKYAPGLEVNWGPEVEKLIKRLSEIFAEYNSPEEDEYGMSRTEFDNLIAHLKYYYDIDKFNHKVLNKIHELLINYDLADDEEVSKILNRLKLYC